MNFSEKNDCLNCDTPLTADFCGHCGQEKAERISFSLLLKIMQRGIIEFKSPLLVTFFGLFINPGKVYREYLDGKRTTYFNPIRYSFWLITLALFVAAYYSTSIIDFGAFFSEEEQKSNPLTKLKLKDFLDSSIIYITFINALISAISLKLFFRKEKYSISELYIPCLLNYSQVFIIAIIMIPIGFYTTIQGQLFYFACATVYFVWGISHLFENRTWKTYFKVIISGILSYIAFSILFGVLVVLNIGMQQFIDDSKSLQDSAPIVAPQKLQSQ